LHPPARRVTRERKSDYPNYGAMHPVVCSSSRSMLRDCFRAIWTAWLASTLRRSSRTSFGDERSPRTVIFTRTVQPNTCRDRCSVRSITWSTLLSADRRVLRNFVQSPARDNRRARNDDLVL
jgi:hypothetical protein